MKSFSFLLVAVAVFVMTLNGVAAVEGKIILLDDNGNYFHPIEEPLRRSVRTANEPSE